MRHSVLAVALLMSCACCAVAQASPAASAPGAAADPQLAAALKDISPRQIQATIEKLVSFHNRNTLSASDPQAIASGKGIGAAREWIRAEFERYSKDCGGCLEVKTDVFTEGPAPRIPKLTELVNVYAIQRGTDPEAAKRIYLVTGHYDSRNSDTFNVTDPAPGANDDGSGTSVSLECARVLSKHKFPATIIYLTVAGEEQGLNGSTHFAKMAKEQGWNIDAALNNDIVGGNKSPQQRTNLVRVFSEGIPSAATERQLKFIRAIGAESDAPSRQLARYIHQVGATYFGKRFEPVMIFRPDRYLRGGDHTSFNEQGFAAVRFTEWLEDFNRQHQTPRTESGVEYADLPKYVDFDYVANVARVNAATLASLASAPAAPGNVKLLTKQLENDSTLTWDSSPGAAGYQVVWRATTAPDWEHAQSAGNATRLTIRESKDNVVFGVRSLDSHGNQSLTVLPSPER